MLYRQLRVGRHGKRFEMLKFRTMVPGADAMKEALRAHNEARGGLFKIVEDPRVTRVGRWLRRTALDELPQLLNILKGEMSLVGPRPLVVEEDERIAGRHRRRLELMPGMTGPWQILGPTRASLSQMVAIDYRYVEYWSLWKTSRSCCEPCPMWWGGGGCRRATGCLPRRDGCSLEQLTVAPSAAQTSSIRAGLTARDALGEVALGHHDQVVEVCRAGLGHSVCLVERNLCVDIADRASYNRDQDLVQDADRAITSQYQVRTPSMVWCLAPPTPHRVSPRLQAGFAFFFVQALEDRAA